jgi:hypothetical protein
LVRGYCFATGDEQRRIEQVVESHLEEITGQKVNPCAKIVVRPSRKIGRPRKYCLNQQHVKEHRAMVAPLTWTSIIPALLMSWTIGFIIALLETFALRKKMGRMTFKTLYAPLFTFLQWGSLFSIFGIAQQLYFRGFITLEMQIVMMGLAVLCSVSSVYHTIFQVRINT